jgi:exonuclease SbcC
LIVRSLKLQGIRSWEDGETKFCEGFTAIVGPKGAGKSSLIDGIEFALFGDKAFPEYRAIIREGSSSSEVELNVAYRGKNHYIHRGLTRTQDSISQDPSRLSIAVEETIYTRNKATDLDRDVKTFLNIDKNLLENTCLTKQEELKSLLNMGPRDRKRVIDELLQLDAFESAWQGLGNIITERDGYLKRLKEDAAKYDLEALSKEYDQTVQQIGIQKKERQELIQTLESERQKLEGLKQTVEKLDTEASEFLELKRQIEQQQKQSVEEKGKAQRIGGQIATYQNMLDNLEKEERDIREKISAFWNNLEGLDYKGQKNVEALQEWIKSLEEETKKLSNAVSGDKRALEEEMKREKELIGKENCPYCGQPLVSHQAQQFHQERLRHMQALRSAIAENQASLANVTYVQEKAERVFGSLDKLYDRLEHLQDQTQENTMKIEELQGQLKAVEALINDVEKQIKALESSLPKYDEVFHNRKRQELMDQTTLVSKLEGDIRTIDSNLEILGNSLNEVSKKIQEGKELYKKVETQGRMVEELGIVRKGCRAVLPELRSMYLRAIEDYVQKTYNNINPTSTFLIRIDENYTPEVKIRNYTRSYRDLSGGERTDIALAYRIGLGNAIYEARTGTPMELLILDEPTENLGNEEGDRSIEQLAQMLANLKVQQIITITHDQTFARFADHTIQIRKINEKSQIVQN